MLLPGPSHPIQAQKPPQACRTLSGPTLESLGIQVGEAIPAFKLSASTLWHSERRKREHFHRTDHKSLLHRLLFLARLKSSGECLSVSQPQGYGHTRGPV